MDAKPNIETLLLNNISYPSSRAVLLSRGKFMGSEIDSLGGHTALTPLMVFFINFNSPGRLKKKTTKNDLSWGPCNCLIFSITLDKWMSGRLFHHNVSWQARYFSTMCHFRLIIHPQCVM
jgi:hypothetical protein